MELFRLVGIIIFGVLLVGLTVGAALWRRKLKQEDADRWNRSKRTIDSNDK
ncbi:hypothetical protein ACFLVO_03010 [Chloroflexota bacterium]